MLFLVGILYRKDVMAKPVPGKPEWFRFRKMLALLALTLTPILLVNFLLPREVLRTADDKIELGKKEHNIEWIARGYKELSVRYPDSLEVQFQYIDELIHFQGYKWEDIRYDYSNSKKATRLLLQVYIEVVSDAPVVKLSRLDSLPQDAPFVHYVRGLAYKSMHPKEYNQVRYHIRKEVVLHPGCQRAWEFLWTLFMRGHHEKELDALMQNSDATRFIPVGYRQDYYFEHGQWENYAATVLENRVLDVALITLLSAFLVSFVWLVFLRSMDIFNREKWWNIALVFLGGAAFTFFCLPIYDYAHLVLHLRINGEIWNDFLYCVAVIGGGEELVKLLPWVIFAVLSRRFREPYDYILYASVSALGFAFTENLMYLEDSGNIVVRSIMSTVGHMFDASVVAYAIILAKYKFTNRFWKIVTPVIGFFFAALCHGFYDFWLISPAAEGYDFVTFIFFMLSLHVWFFFKNNAMNNSGFFGNGSFNAGFQQDLLTFSILAILMLEFLAISFKFGSAAGNSVIGGRALIIVFFLVYISVIIHKIDLKKGVWQKWRFRMPSFSGGFLRLPFGMSGRYSSDVEDYDDTRDHIGLRLRLFAPRTNQYIGDKLPKSGICVSKIVVSGDPGWYVFQFNTPLHFNNYVPTHVVIRSKDKSEALDDPKIEIYFMFIPDIDLLKYESLEIKQLRYAGRAYSMPVD